jgi:hypothetical protein
MTLLLVMLVLCTGIFLLACASVALSVRKIETRVDQLERRAHPLPSLPTASDRVSALAGLRVGLVLTQDHPHAPFVDLLRQQLLLRDVSDVTVFPDAASARASALDIVVEGALTCNGYAEVYYAAEFTCSTCGEAVCTLIERPPGGDRPSNLAMELVAKLDAKLTDMVSRNERRRAIRELGSP